VVRRLVAATALVVVLATAAIAWFMLDPGPLHRIVVTWSDPEPTSARPFWQIAIEEHGTYTYVTHSFERHGKIAFAPYAQRFRSIGEIRWALPPRAGGEPGMQFWAVGTRRAVAPFAYGNGSDLPALRAFGAALHDAVVADQPNVDAPRFAALNGLEQLRSIEMRASGAMCGRCVWTMRIDASGHAHAHTDQPFNDPGPREHDASLRWRDVVGSLRRAQLGRLDEHYLVQGTDVAGISFRFVFPQRSYSIVAPDYMGWPPSLRHAVVDVMAQLERARWSSPIDPRSLPDAASMRAWANHADPSTSSG
jgi:hypothetical protein